MRRLLALGVGCLFSITASAEDLLTIFDQAVVNDPLVREAEFTRKATREARPQAWAYYLPQINGNYTKGKSEGNRTQAGSFLIEDPTDPAPEGSRRLVLQQQVSDSSFEPDTEGWTVQLRQSVFNWGQLVGLRQAGKIAAQADADYSVAQEDLALRVSQ